MKLVYFQTVNFGGGRGFFVKLKAITFLIWNYSFLQPDCYLRFLVFFCKNKILLLNYFFLSLFFVSSIMSFCSVLFFRLFRFFPLISVFIDTCRHSVLLDKSALIFIITYVSYYISLIRLILVCFGYLNR